MLMINLLKKDLTQWFIHLCSLPCIHNDFNEPENFSFLSVHTTIDVTNDYFVSIDDVNKHVLINSLKHVDNQFQERINTLDQISYLPETNFDYDKLVVYDEEDNDKSMTQTSNTNNNNDCIHKDAFNHICSNIHYSLYTDLFDCSFPSSDHSFQEIVPSYFTPFQKKQRN